METLKIETLADLEKLVGKDGVRKLFTEYFMMLIAKADNVQR